MVTRKVKLAICIFLLALTVAGCGPGKEFEAKKQAVIKSVTSYREGSTGSFNPLQFACETMASFQSEIRWDAYLKDRKEEIWTVECSANLTSITSSGKVENDVVLLTFLYDISTQRLYVQDEGMRNALYQGGANFDLSSSPPSLIVRYIPPE